MSLVNQNYKRGDRVKHLITGTLGTVCGHPSEFDENYVNVKWDDVKNNWPCGYITHENAIKKEES